MSSPRRTVAVLASLVVGAVALAVGVTAAVERGRPDLAILPPPPFQPTEIPRFDVHQHVTPDTVAEAVRLARAHGIGALVNQSGGSVGGGLEESLAATRAHGDARVLVLANPDLRGCCGAEWQAREVAALEEAVRLGAAGVALPSPPGGDRSLAIDDPALDPVFAACARLGAPAFLHGGGPLAPLSRRLARHPGLPFVVTNLAGLADPAAAGRLLDEHPNLSLDLAAVGALGRDPAAARAVVLAHADRLLFGTDLRYVEIPPDVKAVVFGAGMPGGREEMLRFFGGTWRFLETRDAAIPSPVPAEGDFPIAGIGLPRDALERIYHRNAERLLGVRVPPERER